MGVAKTKLSMGELLFPKIALVDGANSFESFGICNCGATMIHSARHGQAAGLPAWRCRMGPVMDASKKKRFVSQKNEGGGGRRQRLAHAVCDAAQPLNATALDHLLAICLILPVTPDDETV